MAEATATPRKRQRPRTGAARPAAEPEANGAKARGQALYHVYSENEDNTLARLGQFLGRNASEAIEAYIEAGNNAEGITFVVVPDRNLARVKAAVETKTKVKLSAA